MGTKVFLDDERDAPEGWIRVRTAAEAFRLLQEGNDAGAYAGLRAALAKLCPLLPIEEVWIEGNTPPESDARSSGTGSREGRR